MATANFQTMNALVLVNSGQPEYHQGRVFVLPYLEHFGVPCDVVDLLHHPLPVDANRYPLVILAHPNLDPGNAWLGGRGGARLRDAVRAGSGLVSFDAALSHWLVGSIPEQPRIALERLEIAGGAHYITALHEADHSLALSAPLEIASLPEGEVLVEAATSPLLVASQLEKGRLLHWASTGWMHTAVLGPMMGMDDLFWRGLVWAARKPYALRGLPPLMTMRIDDVAGRGGLFNQSPLYWVENAVQEGFKPWLGIFIYNLSAPAVNQLRGLVQAKQATAFPHAFGRPNRSPEMNYFYYEDALPLRANEYDEFIYFDHHHGIPWPDSEARRGMEAVDRWYQAHMPLPKSKMALPHWGEMGDNTISHMAEKWGAEYIFFMNDINLPMAKGIPWPKLGPFRRYEDQGECFPWTEGERGGRPVYYADFANVAGYPFFMSMTEIRDDAGYEWAPDNNVEATVQRGIRQLRRALDSMTLPNLFTHETDFIHKIAPQNWAEIMHGIAQGIAAYNPIQVTYDEGIRYVRATKTSSLINCRFDPGTGEVRASLTGKTDLPTHFYVFTGDGGTIDPWLVEVPPFKDNISILVKV
jgi:hypothetical protein